MSISDNCGAYLNDQAGFDNIHCGDEEDYGGIMPIRVNNVLL